MTFWSGERLIEHGTSIISPFSPSQVKANSYELSLGDEVYHTNESVYEEYRHTIKKLKPNQSFTIPPGQFAYLLTKETVRVPTASMAFISFESSIKFAGLINVSGFHASPGYNGKLVFSAFNGGSNAVHIKEGDQIFRIWFADLDRDTAYVEDNEGFSDIPVSIVQQMPQRIDTVPGLIQSMEELTKRTSKIEHQITTARGNQRLLLTLIVLSLTISVTIAVEKWSEAQTYPGSKEASEPMPQ